MPRNGSGTYSLPVGNPVVTGTTISSTWANNTLTDISNALTGSLSADGQTTASGNLNMGTNRIINLGEPSSAQDGATKYYVDQLIAALGTMAYQNASAVAITGGTVTNVTLDLHEMTNEIFLPVGPTALRDATPIQGIMRFNTDGPFYEGYVAGNWHRFLTVNQGSYTITYLAVGGGGGGGPVDTRNGSGGAGGGRVTASTTSVIPGTSILTMTIGAGGASNTSGSPSTITGIVSASGGATGTLNGGASGNGFAGGAGTLDDSGLGIGGGGGGASAVGGSGVAFGGGGGGIGGTGGLGAETLITGTSQYFGAGGGGAGTGTGNGGSGGTGGGGRGGGNWGAATAGTVNTGGGGGSQVATAGANGGSGVIYLSMPTLNYTGTFTGSPTVTTTGSNTVLKYTGSGTYTC
jgi:hypothetical protein